MNSSRFIFMIGVLVICCIAGCGGKVAVYNNPEKPISTQVGEEFVVAIQFDLPGYSWKEHHDKACLYLVEEYYGPVENGTDSVGTAGTQYFRYGALRSGVTNITFTNLRLSEPDIAMERMFQVHIKDGEPAEHLNTPRELTDEEKERVIEIALNTPEVIKWVERTRAYSVGALQWYAIWPHECMRFDYDDVNIDSNYRLVPGSAAWYPGVTVIFAENATTYPIRFQIAVDLQTEKAVWLFGPIEADD